jgi:(4S)-4-hydroxy-5-phosphonooxypentane-2,3-dione isomerase
MADNSQLRSILRGPLAQAEERRWKCEYSGTPHIVVVEFDIVPAEIDKFITAIKELGAAAVNELGCRQFSIAISQKDTNHVLLFEVWDNAAALDAQFATDRFKKYQATTANMVAKRSDIRAFSPVAMNIKGK